MSEITGRGRERDTVSPAAETSWQKPAAADDIVDPIDGIDDPIADGFVDPIDGETANAREFDADRDRSAEEEEDVPLDVKLTDALSMLADGGHDYGSRPIVEEEPDDAAPGEDRPIDLGDIDESSKDA